MEASRGNVKTTTKVDLTEEEEEGEEVKEEEEGEKMEEGEEVEKEEGKEEEDEERGRGAGADGEPGWGAPDDNDDGIFWPPWWRRGAGECLSWLQRLQCHSLTLEEGER